MNNIYYTYVYLDTRKSGFYSYSGLNNERFVFNYEPFYIGKGKNNRFKDHLLDELEFLVDGTHTFEEVYSSPMKSNIKISVVNVEENSE